MTTGIAVRDWLEEDDRTLWTALEILADRAGRN
jgi:hypothetical protein